MQSLAWFTMYKCNEQQYYYREAKQSAKVIATDGQFWLDLGTTMWWLLSGGFSSLLSLEIS